MNLKELTESEDVRAWNLDYTRDALIEELALLERHIRDGSWTECYCIPEKHLPVVSGLAGEGTIFAMSEQEKRFYEWLRDFARFARHQIESGEFKVPEMSNPSIVTVEKLLEKAREGKLQIIDSKNSKFLLYDPEQTLYYVVKGNEILWSGEQEIIARNVFEGRDPETELPPRGTGLITGTARRERGRGKPLSEEERKERHKEIYGNPVGEARVGERFIHETLMPETACEPSSFRTVIRDQHRIIVCCPKGEWDPRTQRCRVGMVAQKIEHPATPEEIEKLKERGVKVIE